MCWVAAEARRDLQPSGTGGKSTPPWAGAAGATQPQCPDAAAQGQHQQPSPSPVLPIPSWGRQRLHPPICTSPSSMNHCVPASLPHLSLSSDTRLPRTILWVPFKATSTRHRSWHLSARGTANPGD